MSNTIIKLENISKQYRLGQVGTQTLRGDFQRWWHTLRGKEDPTLKIVQTNQLNSKLETGNREQRTVNSKLKTQASTPQPSQPETPRPTGRQAGRGNSKLQLGESVSPSESN